MEVHIMLLRKSDIKHLQALTRQFSQIVKVEEDKQSDTVILEIRGSDDFDKKYGPIRQAIQKLIKAKKILAPVSLVGPEGCFNIQKTGQIEYFDLPDELEAPPSIAQRVLDQASVTFLRHLWN